MGLLLMLGQDLFLNDVGLQSPNIWINIFMLLFTNNPHDIMARMIYEHKTKKIIK